MRSAPEPGAAGGAGAALGAPGLRALAAPIAAISTFGVSISMSFPIFALLLEGAGASGTAIGLNAMAAAVSTVIFAPLMPLILRRTGLGRLMIGAALVVVAVFLAIPLRADIWFWSLLRLTYGFAATALFFTSEFWIVAAAPAGRRGRIVALYGLVLSASFMLGPLIVRGLGVESGAVYVVAAAIVLAGVAPILWGLPVAPRVAGERPPRLRDALGFYVSDPALVWAIVLFGAIEFGTLSLLSVWGIRAGLGEGDAVLLLSFFAFGAMALQLPLGWTADRFEPRALLCLAGLVSVAAPLILVAEVPSVALLAVTTAIWGGFASGLYTVALTALGNRYSGEQLAAATAAVILGYGLGSLATPPAFGAAMDLIDPHGLLLATAGASGLYLALALVRLAAGRRPNSP